METCLFTREPLSSATSEEHTIPRSLGGRVRSKVVSSSEFNNACASKVDPYLHEPYALLMCELGPALAVEHRTGRLDLVDPVTGQRYAMDGEGRHGFSGTRVVKRDQAGRPIVLQGKDPKRLKQIYEQAHGIGATVVCSTVAAGPVAPMNAKPRPFFMAETEVGALKALLLTFDHVLRDSGADRRFTRHPDLAPVREFVRSSVMDDRLFDLSAWNQFSLGLQYEVLPEIEKVRQRVQVPRTEFEHVLVVSGDPARRTVDSVWLIADTDPWGFRLADAWSGPYFTCVLVNGILRETSASGPLWLDFSSIECSPTMRRCLPSRFPISEFPKRKTAYSEVHDRGIDAYRRAVFYVENNCDEAVKRSISDIALLNSEGDRSMLLAVKEHLERGYAFRIKSKGGSHRFNNVIELGTRSIPAAVLHQAVDGSQANKVEWDHWLPIYRGLLREMVCELGMPGETKSGFAILPGHPSDPRPLGDVPDAPDLGTGWNSGSGG